MIATPPRSIERHARMKPSVDELAAIGDLIGGSSGIDLGPRLEAACAFLDEQLLPHMEAEERALYAELERVMQNRHSMTPMRREHEAIRALVADLRERRREIGDGPVRTGTAVALRRALFQLHALLKVHLAEEDLYADLVEHGPSPEAEAGLAAVLRRPGA
jgi:hypothetical protein